MIGLNNPRDLIVDTVLRKVLHDEVSEVARSPEGHGEDFSVLFFSLFFSFSSLFFFFLFLNRIGINWKVLSRKVTGSHAFKDHLNCYMKGEMTEVGRRLL